MSKSNLISNIDSKYHKLKWVKWKYHKEIELNYLAFEPEELVELLIELSQSYNWFIDREPNPTKDIQFIHLSKNDLKLKENLVWYFYCRYKTKKQTQKLIDQELGTEGISTTSLEIKGNWEMRERERERERERWDQVVCFQTLERIRFLRI